MPAVPPKSSLPPGADAGEAKSASPAEELAPEDFYYEGPYMVFTAAYHLKRGFCCHSGCRHCPYREQD
jgi:hypothetical protein